MECDNIGGMEVNIDVGCDKFCGKNDSRRAHPDIDFRVSREGVDSLANVSIYNPYPTPLPICEISYSLRSDGREVASGKIADPRLLKAKASTTVEVVVKLAHSRLVSLGRDIAKDWDIDYQLDLVFIIDLPVVGDISIPLSQQGEIKPPALIAWFTYTPSFLFPFLEDFIRIGPDRTGRFNRKPVTDQIR